jgi:hypothetical protein
LNGSSTEAERAGAVSGDGYTALHWAAVLGTGDVIPLLIASGVSVDVLGPCDETPLHRASRLGARECIKQLLKLGADPRLRNRQWLTALDVAGQYEGRTHIKSRNLARRLILETVQSQRTMILYHNDCLGHATPSYHQESPERLTAIMGKLRDTKRFDRWETVVKEDFPVANDTVSSRSVCSRQACMLTEACVSA